SQGHPLDSSTRVFFEHRFGHDLSLVRVHTDARAAESARMVDALAYTVGHNIVFGGGQYAPETPMGQRLVAHELTHVIQQTGGVARSILQRKPTTQSATKKGVTFWYSVQIRSELSSEQLLLEFIKQYYNLSSDEEAQDVRQRGGWRWIGMPQIATA